MASNDAASGDDEAAGRAAYRDGWSCDPPDYRREDRRARWRIGWKKEQAASGIPSSSNQITPSVFKQATTSVAECAMDWLDVIHLETLREGPDLADRIRTLVNAAVHHVHICEALERQIQEANDD